MSRGTRDPHDPEASGGLVRRLMPWERDFSQIANSWLRDSSLSFVSRGILAFLFTHEPGYKITLKALAELTPKAGKGEGIDGIRAAVNELEKANYLRRRPTSKGGQFSADLWELVDPTGLADPALFGDVDLVDKSRFRRVGSGNAGGHRVGSANAYRVGSANDIKNTIKNTRATPAAASPSASPDLWKTTLTSEPCSKPRGHTWPSLRAAHAEASLSGGLVTCLNACGVQVSVMRMDAAASGALT
jgi:hypothetical protein